MSVTKYISKQFAKPEGIGGKLSTFTMNLLNRSQYRYLLDELTDKKIKSILDIGFGNGYLLTKLISNNMADRYYGIEISQDMIDSVEAKYDNFSNLSLTKESVDSTHFGTPK